MPRKNSSNHLFSRPGHLAWLPLPTQNTDFNAPAHLRLPPPPPKKKQAEEEFLQAGKPREAIDMFVHQKAWADACRVAEGHDPSAVSDVLCAQAVDVAAAGDRAAAEELFVRAAKPEKALQVK